MNCFLHFLCNLAFFIVLLVHVEGTCYRQLDPESREVWHRIRHNWYDIECYGYADNASFREMRENPADCFVAHNCYIPEFGKDDLNDIRGCTDLGWHDRDYCNDYIDHTAKAKLSEVCESCRQCFPSGCNRAKRVGIRTIHVVISMAFALLMFLLSTFNH